MNQNLRLQRITAAALLIAVGVIIPMVFPKVSLPPASFTLASHVPVFIAMFISPAVAISVALGTTLGFFFSGMLPIVTVRAATHLIFAVLGAFYLQRRPGTLASLPKSQMFSFGIGLMHAAAEVAAVSWFYFAGFTEGYYDKGYLISVVLLVGVGSLVHSMLDFGIALVLVRVLSAQKSLRPMFADGAYLPAK